MEPSTGQPEVGQIAIQYLDARMVGEAFMQPCDPVRMQLDRQHPGTGGGQRSGQGTVAGTEIENEIAGTQTGAGDQLLGPIRPQPVPSPEALR